MPPPRLTHPPSPLPAPPAGEKYYCAVPEGMFEKGNCGKCAKVCGADGCVLAKVVDACASCSYGDIDLSKRALKDATGFEWDRKAVT